MQNKLEYDYWQWLMWKIKADDNNHKRLLSYLHSVPFYPKLPLDENRAFDGIQLRYFFGVERGLDDSITCHVLDNKPCSILEMMIALADRFEVSLMINPSIGDRTHVWFWNMINSMGLLACTDNAYDEEYVDNVLRRFVNNDYASNGAGGLFTVNNAPCDMRSVEIWTQAGWYFNDIIDKDNRYEKIK